MRFFERVVLVTGGARGIGAGCCRVFSNEGAYVAVVDRDLHAAKTMVDSLPRPAIAIQADVSSEIQVRDAIQRTVDRFGQLDCLINNAGIHPPDTPLTGMPPEQVVDVLRINFLSTYTACYYALEHLKKTKGTIVNISSMTAVLGQRNSTAYAASKGAQLSFTKSLALECADFGIRVNAILPSNVDTPLMRAWAATLPDPDAALERIAALQPLGRMADVEEIGRVCLFLATTDSSFITGQGLHVDGGASLDY
ncbi:MAG: SDR family NAD(P)-dependent oxidoreductase [Planctomycetota bacterium]